MPKSDPGIFNTFYYFWLWEYCRRNPAHSVFFKELCEQTFDQLKSDSFIAKWTSTQGVKLEMELVAAISDGGRINLAQFSEVFGIFSITFADTDKIGKEFYVNSRDIVCDILENRFKHRSPQPNSKPRHVVEFHDDRFDKLASRAGYHRHPESGEKYIAPGFILCAIPLLKDIEEIINDIRLLHRQYNEFGPIGFCDAVTRNGSIKRGGISRLPKHPDRDLTRAIGIWLWDYVENNNISWKHRAKAYTAFQDTYHHQDSQISVKGYRDPKQLAELLDLAKACIEHKEVLPGS